MTSLWLCSIYILIIGLSSCTSKKIMIIPVSFGSHVRTMAAVGEVLMDDGHDVTFLVADFSENVLTKKGMPAIVYPGAKLKEVHDVLMANGIPLFAKGERFGTSKSLFELTSQVVNVCDAIMHDEGIMNNIKSQKFDLIITEGYHLFGCMNILPYYLDIPFIIYNMQPFSWAAGVPSMPSFEPSFFMGYTADMTFIERFINLFVTAFGLYMVQGGELIGKYMPHKSDMSLNDVAHKAEMWLVNTENCLDYPRVSAPHYQFIGSSSTKPPKALPNDLEEFMMSAKQGVIVMSYGSTEGFREVLKIHINKFFNAFKNIEQKVLLALQCDDMDVPSNVRCMNWMPQNDLLGHKNTVLFISHGGANGQLEAIGHGVPMISIGIMAEQFYNSRRIEYNGYGKQLILHEFTSEELVNAIQEITSNKMYYENTRKCAEIIKDFPPASENVLFWVNHILKFGGSHLHPKSLDMPFYKLFMLDVLLVLLLSVIVLLITTYCLCCFIIRRCCRKHTEKVKLA